MALRLRFQNMAPAVCIAGNWYARIRRTLGTGEIFGGSGTLNGSASLSTSAYLPCSEADALAVVRSYSRPALRFDGPVYIEDALTIAADESAEIVRTGGYLGAVSQTGRRQRYYVDSEGWYPDPDHICTYSFDLLGVVAGPYTTGLKLSGLRIPAVESGVNAPPITPAQRDYMTGAEQPQWPASPLVLRFTNATGGDGFFVGSNPTTSFGHCVQSTKNRLAGSMLYGWQKFDEKWNLIGNSNAIAISIA